MAWQTSWHPKVVYTASWYMYIGTSAIAAKPHRLSISPKKLRRQGALLLVLHYLQVKWQQLPPLNDGEYGIWFDRFAAHLTEGTKARLDERNDLAIIPDGLARILQSLDRCISKVFKGYQIGYLKELWADWIANGKHSFTLSRLTRCPTITLGLVAWLLKGLIAYAVDKVKITMCNLTKCLKKWRIFPIHL